MEEDLAADKWESCTLNQFGFHKINTKSKSNLDEYVIGETHQSSN